MLYYELPELSEEEKKLPLSKYYTDYPLYCLPPLQQQLIDAGPMDPKDALPVERWLEALMEPGNYEHARFGYCMLPDGAGCYSEFTVVPAIPGYMKAWFMKFINHRSKNMPADQGNLRYKLWCPIDHWDRGFVNGVDASEGTWSIGSLDQGETPRHAHAKEYVHMIDLREYGLSEERQKKLEEQGCRISAGWEDFEGEPGHHLWIHIDRPCPFGGVEMIGWEWLGYYVKDGKIVRDEETPVNEEMLKKILIHNAVEHMHLPQFLPDLYNEYKDLPLDAD